LDAILESGFPVVDHMVGAELRSEIEIGCRHSGRNFSPVNPRELDGERSHRARSAVNQNMFARLEFCMIEESLPGRQRADRHGRRFFVCQVVPLGSDGVERRSAILGHGAVGVPVIHSEHVLPELQATHVFAHSDHCSREFMSRDRTGPRFAGAPVRSWVPG
jgi:hypothetical protein